MLTSSKLIVSITDGNRKIVILSYTTVKSLFENQVIVNSARGVGGRRNKVRDLKLQDLFNLFQY